MRTSGRVPWRLGILAAFAALATSCEEIQVTAVEVASLTVDPSEGTVAPGDTLRLRATLRDASGNSLDNRPIEWRSEDPEVVRLEGEGLVRGMSPGTTTVRASSEGVIGEASITVQTGPGMVLSRSRLTFEAVAGGDPTNSNSVGISMEGPGILEGIEVSVTHPSGEPTGWLDATLAGTTAPTVVSVRADPSALPAGTHRADVEVIASAAANSPQVIEVIFEVEEAFPVVSLEPQAVGFAVAEGEGVPPPQVVSVTNTGGGELTDLEASISYAENQPTGWLDAGLEGTTAPTELTLRVDLSGLKSPAVFDAVVDVTSPVAESPRRIQVRFRLGEPPPEIDLNPTEIGWEIVEDDESPPTRAVAIEKQGTGTLGGLSAEVVYGAGAAGRWLEVVVESSVAPAVLTASLANTALLPGGYEATIQVLSNDAINSPQSVGVSLQVAPRASPETSSITTSHGVRVADGSSTAVIAVQLRDSRGDAMPSGGDAVQLSATLGSLSPVSDQGDGTYTANLTSTTSGTATVSGTANGDPIGDQAVVQFVVGDPANVVITGGNNQTDTVGQTLDDPLQVRVRDSQSNPRSGVTVTWTPASGDGSANPTTSKTNASGIASTSWTLGSSPGAQSLEASVTGVTPVTFSATAEAVAPESVVIESGNNQTGTVGQTLGSPLEVRVTDSQSKPLSGVTVTWIPASGDGSANPTTSKTNASGIASTSWTLGSSPGAQSLEASVSGVAQAATFSATAEAGSPASVVVASGNNQTGTVGQTLGSPLEVRVTDSQSKPLSGVTVTWTPASGDGSANPTTSKTNASGIASASWTLGSSPGAQSLEASVTGVGSVTFNATAEAEDDDDDGKITLAITSGDNQSGPAGEALPLELGVRVRYAQGPPLSGVTVSWEADEGSASPSSSQTASNGRATTTWTLGSSPGSQTLRASVAGVGSVTFHATAEADDDDRTPCTEMEALLADLRAIEDANPGSDLADKLEDVRQKVEAAHLERCVKRPPDREAAAGNIEDAVDDMLDAIEDGLIGTSQGVGFLDRLLWVSRTMAIEAIEAAEARRGRQRDIERAEALVAEGDALHAAGEFEDAAEKYTDAVSEAEGA